MDEHDLVVAVKNLALELGTTPTRGQFEKYVKNVHTPLSKIIGGYSTLLKMAGLVPYQERRVTNKIFETSIGAHIDNFNKIEDPLFYKKDYPSILIISDIHWPFSCQKVLDAFLKRVALKKPQYVILNGDAWDMYSHSKFPKSHNIFTPREEEKVAREENENFWKEVQKKSPQSKCIQMLGNHDVRPLKRVLESYPEAEDWIKEKMEKLFTFENVKTIQDPREEVLLGNIAIFHGYRTKLGDHRDYTLYNTINGHTHVGGTVFRKIRGDILWELNSGMAGNPEAKGLTYTPQKITHWTKGFGEVDEEGPRFIWV